MCQCGDKYATHVFIFGKGTYCLECALNKAELIEFYGGPKDGEKLMWPLPLPPVIYFPVSPRLTKAVYNEEELDKVLDIKRLVYRHRSLGRYDYFGEE